MAMVLREGEEVIPGYRLVRKLGRGGFGEAWQAEAPGEVQVALKFIELDSEAAEPELRALKVIKNVRHPNLLDVQFALSIDNHLVIASPLCDRSLADRLKEIGRRGLPDAEVSDYLGELTKAVDFLNDARHDDGAGTLIGIQHRDIKPQNVFLCGGSIRLADFGLAKILECQKASHTGSMTPSYVAPEVLQGFVTRNSDQYSLAVTYCEMRGGQLPFTGGANQVIFGHLHREPDLQALPPEERPIVARALAKDPEKRWSCCVAFEEALRDASAPLAIRSRHRSTPSAGPPGVAPLGSSRSPVTVVGNDSSTGVSGETVGGFETTGPATRAHPTEPPWEWSPDSTTGPSAVSERPPRPIDPSDARRRPPMLPIAIGLGAVAALVVAALFYPRGDGTPVDLDRIAEDFPPIVPDRVASGDPPDRDAPDVPIASSTLDDAASADHVSPSSTPEARTALGFDHDLRMVDEYLEGLGPDDRPHYRFVTLTHLHDDPVGWTAQDLRTARDAFSMAVIGLGNLRLGTVHPKAIDDEGTVFAIDLRELGWEVATWQLLLNHYPYGLSFQGSGNEALEDLEGRIVALAGNATPILRADWFVAATSNPGLGNALLPEIFVKHSEMFVKRETFEEMVFFLGDSDLERESIRFVARRFNADLGPSAAAAELGLETEALIEALADNDRLLELGLRPLTQGGRVSRADWERLFPLAAGLGPGIPTAY